MPAMREGPDSYRRRDIQHLQALICLLPILGVLPAFWTLTQQRGTRKQRAVSRWSITLALLWLGGYVLLATGANVSEFWNLPLLLLNSLLTSAYFLVSVGLMIRLWRDRQP